MTPAEILKPICSSDTTRPNLATPFGMDFKGKRWLAAPDGHIAVALLGECDLRTGAPDLSQVIGVEPPPAFRASVAALREWAGPVPSPPEPPTAVEVPCEECDGEGKVCCFECGREGAKCSDCEGSGKVESLPDPPSPSYGVIFSGTLNRALLAKVLATLPADVTEVRIGLQSKLSPYILRARGWLAAIMPVNGDAPKDTPKFTEFEPAATVPA